MGELWVTIPDHQDFEINTYGEVRYKGTDILVKPSMNRGYYRVRLDGNRYYIHKLMMQSFHPDEDDSRYVKHIDGDKTNNCLWNLRYALRECL